MRALDLFKKIDDAKLAKQMGQFRRNPRILSGQIVAVGNHSDTERLPTVMVESPVDLDPESETFGKLKSLVGFTPIGDWWL